MDSNEQFQDLDKDWTDSKRQSLRNQIAALERDIATNIKMKQRLEHELEQESDPNRKAELSESTASLSQILQNYIDENLKKKQQLELELLQQENSGSSTPEIAPKLNQSEFERSNSGQSESVQANLNPQTEPSEPIQQSLHEAQANQRDSQPSLVVSNQTGTTPVDLANTPLNSDPASVDRATDIQPSGLHSLERHDRRSQKTRKAALAVLTGVLVVASMGWYWYTDTTSRCNKELTKTGNRHQEALDGQKVLDACIAMTNLQPNNANAWKNAGRASLVTWIAASDDKTKMEIVDRTKDYFQKAVEKSNRLDPQALFYRSFMEDFEDFVLKPKISCKTSAKARYKEALSIYQSTKYELLESDRFILLELGHFLIHRDRDAQTADNLLDSVIKANPDPNYQNTFRRNILINKAKAETYLNQYQEAKDSLEEALKYDSQSYKIRQDLGSIYGQIAIDDSVEKSIRDDSRRDAIANYQRITEDNLTSNVYSAWRNLGLLLYLHEEYVGAVDALDKALSFTKAIQEFDQPNAQLIRSYRDLAKACRQDQNCAPDTKITLIKELRKRKIFSSNFITHDILENEVSDPFFDVEHDKFYKCQS